MTAMFISHRTIVTIVSAAIIATTQPARAADVARANRTAPAFALTDAVDRQLTLQSFSGRPLVINVFASWCPPCREELPRIVGAAHAGLGKIAFLGVDEQEPVEIGARFVQTMKIPYPVGFDSGQFAASYGAHALPVTIFIGADGIVRAIHHGTISGAELKRRIAAIRLPN